MPTFTEAAERVIRLHSKTWKPGSRLPAQWRQTLSDYAYPTIGQKRVNRIVAADVMTVLSPIWSSKPSVARVVRQRIGAGDEVGGGEGLSPGQPSRRRDHIGASKGERARSPPGAPARAGRRNAPSRADQQLATCKPSGLRVRGPDSLPGDRGMRGAVAGDGLGTSGVDDPGDPDEVKAGTPGSAHRIGIDGASCRSRLSGRSRFSRQAGQARLRRRTSCRASPAWHCLHGPRPESEFPFLGVGASGRPGGCGGGTGAHRQGCWEHMICPVS